MWRHVTNVPIVPARWKRAASAPVKVENKRGASPRREEVWLLVAEGNCAARRRGGGPTSERSRLVPSQPPKAAALPHGAPRSQPQVPCSSRSYVDDPQRANPLKVGTLAGRLPPPPGPSLGPTRASQRRLRPHQTAPVPPRTAHVRPQAIPTGLLPKAGRGATPVFSLRIGEGAEKRSLVRQSENKGQASDGIGSPDSGSGGDELRRWPSGFVRQRNLESPLSPSPAAARWLLPAPRRPPGPDLGRLRGQSIRVARLL